LTRERWEVEFAKSKREADERALQAAEARRQRFETELERAESEAQERRERAVRERRQQWEAEYERVATEAEAVRGEGLADVRAQEAQWVPGKYGTDKKTTRRERAKPRRRWARHDEG